MVRKGDYRSGSSLASIRAKLLGLNRLHAPAAQAEAAIAQKCVVAAFLLGTPHVPATRCGGV